MSMYEKPIANMATKPATPFSIDILICTPDMRSERFKRTLESVYSTTRGIRSNIQVYDNRGDPQFSHAIAINKAAAQCSGNLVTLDDDVIVQGDWLEACLDCIKPDVAFVAPSVTRHNTPWCRAWTTNEIGKPLRWWEDITEPVDVPAMGSCCIVYSQRATQMLRRDEGYLHYYGDPALCLQAWDRGFNTITIPQTIQHNNDQKSAIEPGCNRYEMFATQKNVLQIDRAKFVKDWITSGRLARLILRYKNEWPQGLDWGAV